MRAVFDDEDDALAVAARLQGDGFTATVGRARFAGEDDDEDQPWQVETDAPEVMLEILVEQRDGWVEHVTPAPSAPLDLPAAPRRVHRSSVAPRGGVGGGT